MIFRNDIILYGLLGCFFIFSMHSCKKKESNTLFTLVDSSKTGIHFNNELYFTEDYNPYTFKNFFNGGGVGVGDINNDGLPDILFTGNLSDNKLYLNKGNLEFEDITEKAGVACSGVWSTGVSFVDINGDGWQDIYICKSGRPGGANRHNELFINNGDLTFSEQSKSYGLDFLGLSTHAAFFDFDRDGDLDCYLLNNSLRSVGGYDIAEGLREEFDSLGGNRLLRNEQIQIINGDTIVQKQINFVDVSQQAGIYGSAIGFGLGVSISDVNGDDWPDLFVSNDFFERDYLYINNQNGTFKEILTQAMPEISLGSMGADISDMNNDLMPDIFVTEMLPESSERYKTKAVFENWDKYALNVQKGYHRQFGRNVLQINQTCPETGIIRFSEIGRYSGVEATDWSWGALAADYNLDGHRDIFVANGIYKDLTDLDYVNFDFNPDEVRRMIQNKEKVITRMMSEVPSEPQSNYLFINDGHMRFNSVAQKEGMDQKGFSNGSAYADIDNDGDLDIIVNNINTKASIYRNNTITDKQSENYLRVTLKGTTFNTGAIGAKVVCYFKNNQSMSELHPMRGFESCVDVRLLFACERGAYPDSIKITWPDGKLSRIFTDDIKRDIEISYYNSHKMQSNSAPFHYDLWFSPSVTDLRIRHNENEYVDFDKDPLLFEMHSNEGPKIFVEDLNDDGLEDFVVGGALGFETQLFFQTPDGQFKKDASPCWDATIAFEDAGIYVHDFNKDGVKDLFLCTGAPEINTFSGSLKSRIYIQKENRFIYDREIFVPYSGHVSSMIFTDVNDDGHDDIITAGRMEAEQYGVPCHYYVYLFKNGKYVPDNAFSAIFAQFGMVKDAIGADIDGDKRDELIFVMDMGAIKVLKWNISGYADITKKLGLENLAGLWTKIMAQDMDNDGDADLIVCNKGLNNRWANRYGQLEIHVNDFDQNGQIEQITCYRNKEGIFPWVRRDELVKQIPGLKKNFLRYSDFTKAKLQDMFPSQILNKSLVYTINEFRTGIFKNDKGKFIFTPLPDQIQWSQQRAIEIMDINEDELPDIIVAGNQYRIKPEYGIDAASYGHVAINQGNMNFKEITSCSSGFSVDGEVRDIRIIHVRNKKKLLVARNNAEFLWFDVKNNP